MSGNNLVGASPTYDTSAQKFGVSALNGGSGTASAQIITGFPFTVESWIRRSGAPGALQVAFGQNAVAYCGASASGNAQASGGSSGTQITTGTNVCDGSWHHLAFVVNSTTSATFYTDGVYVGSGNCPSPNFSQYNFAVGTFGGLAGYAWTGETDEVVIWPFAKYTANFTPPTAPYAGTEGMSALFHLDGNLNDSSVGSNFAPNNANIYYSPSNWLVTGTVAETINAGGCLKTFFSGSGAPTLNFDVSGNTGTLPQIYVQIDGQLPQQFNLAATITPTMPTATTAWPRHFIQVTVKSHNDTSNAWTSQATRVSLTGISFASVTTLYPYIPAPLLGMSFGDSINQGAFTLTGSGGISSLTADSDATLSAPYLLGALLGAEMGIVGFGGQWISPTTPISGAVAGQASDNGCPPLSQAYGLLWSGQARTFPAGLNFILVNIGTNDQVKGGNNTGVTNGLTILLNGLLTATANTTRIILLQPYDTAAQYPATASAFTAAVAAVASSRVSYLTTNGLLDTTQTADGIHPLGVMNMQIASQLAPSIRAAITQNSGTIHTTGTRGGLR